MAQPSPVKMVIPSELTQIPQVQKAILDQVTACGYTEDTIFAIRLAVEEALSNAIRHGNCGDPAKKVTVEFTVTPERTEIRICDEGCGFEPEALPDPTLDENLCRPHGRGVMLMHAYMNEVRFNQRGNCVTMVKIPEKGVPPER